MPEHATLSYQSWKDFGLRLKIRHFIKLSPALVMLALVGVLVFCALNVHYPRLHQMTPAWLLLLLPCTWMAVVNPPVAAVRKAGIIPRLIELLGKDNNRKLQVCGTSGFKPLDQ